MPIRVAMVSLGCSKNQIDAENMLATLKDSGITLVHEDKEKDVVIVNTCGFITSAKEEAIENIIELGTLKKEGRIKGIVVTGCLAQRYKQEISDMMPEVDAVIGIGSNKDIAKAVRKAYEGKKMTSFGAKEDLDINGKRILTTLPYYAYVKIAEGCDNCCSYCAIPLIRGRFRSRTMENIVEEVKWLAKEGVKEIILVAQDTTRYGQDLYGELALAKLLPLLCDINGIEWIRLLYCYPDKITDELLKVMATQPKIVKYIDMPIQHCNDKILFDMNRKSTKKELTQIIDKMRSTVKDIVIRTTLITGFPNESESEFEELAQFVKDTKFDRLGCFAYSAEEDTVAAEMDGQIDEDVKIKRAENIMNEQYRIVEDNNKKKLNTTITVLIEGYDKYGECYFGRSAFDAPDIDGKIFFTSTQKHTMGDFVTVLITDVIEYDLLGELFASL